MANTDSFIDEVTEEVRRDRLFTLFRKWGWVAILLVVLIVGGAAYREYARAQARASAEAFGDSLIAALDGATPDERAAALASIQTDSPQTRALLTLMMSTARMASDPEGAAADLRALASDQEIPERYRDLAILKAHLIAPLDADAAIQELESIARPGAPYRALAMEQEAYVKIDMGDPEGAIAIFRLLEQDADASAGLQQRASQLIVALESGAVLADAAPDAGGASEAGSSDQ